MLPYVLFRGDGDVLGTFDDSIQFLMFEIQLRQFLPTLQLFAPYFLQHLVVVLLRHARTALPLLYLWGQEFVYPTGKNNMRNLILVHVHHKNSNFEHFQINFLSYSFAKLVIEFITKKMFMDKRPIHYYNP